MQMLANPVLCDCVVLVGPVKAPIRKRTKVEDLDLAAVETKVRRKHAEGKLDVLTIPEIKCFLRAHKMPVGGKKAEIVARLAACLADAG